jgi:antitoxin (DNA-binding transcriptional repressor) of toxin-antitoxin stability system
MVMKASTPATTQHRIIPAGQFKATCLQLIDEVHADRSLTLIITKRGKPLAQLTAPPLGIEISAPQVLPSIEASKASSNKATSEAVAEHGKKRKGKKKKKK